MSWLVTGGAGYIGAHVVRAFADAGHRRRRARRPLQRARRASSRRASRSCRARSSTAGCSRPRIRRARRRRRRARRGLQVRGRLGAAAAAHLRAERHRHRDPPRGDGRRTGVERIVFSSSAAVYGTPDVDLVTEETPQAPRVALRRVEAHRRVAARRPGGGGRPAPHVACATSTSSAPGTTRRVRHEPAQPLPARVRRAPRRAHAAHQRRRLPDARRHVRARLHPRRRPRRRARRRGAAARRGGAARAASTTSARATASRSARS